LQRINTMIKKILIKTIKVICLTIALLFILVFLSFVLTIPTMYIADYAMSNPFFSHEDYQKHHNWDTASHISGIDLDNDGIEDFISLSGCAFLTSHHEDIPKEETCSAPILGKLSGVPDVNGQKYITIDNEELIDYNQMRNGTFFSYAYKNDDVWYLVAKRYFWG